MGRILREIPQERHADDEDSEGSDFDMTLDGLARDGARQLIVAVLEPMSTNPVYKPIDLGPTGTEDFIARFVQVLDEA